MRAFEPAEDRETFMHTPIATEGRKQMNRMMLFLSVATLAMSPLVAHAKKDAPEPEYTLTVQSCSCESAAVGDEAMAFVCDVSWDHVIGDAEKATYGASLDVDLLDEGTGAAESHSVELNYDWDQVCEGDTCAVEANFMLMGLTGQTATVTAAVKAFNNGRGGITPRNFRKSTLACSDGSTEVPAEPLN